MQHNIYIYIFIMAAVSFVIRILPLTLIQKQIKSRFIRSFLYYVPYVTLSVMTFPAILYAGASQLSGALALLTGILLAYFNAGLFKVAVSCCLVVLVSELIITHI